MIDIIITTYRNAEKLKICLASIIERTKYVDFNIYLWANDPNEEMKKVIHDAMFIDGIQFTDRIIPIFNDTNDGSFSSDNNEAAQEGDGEFILICNDDVEPIREDWLLNMQTILQRDEKVGAVGALLLYPDKKTIQHCGVIFDERTNGLPYHMLYKQPLNEFVMQNRYYQAITGACMLVRRKDFERLGGFNEQYKYGYEDTHLCLQMRKELKKSSVYCASAQLIHHEGVSGKFKQHPNLKENMKVFRDHWGGKTFNDHKFYLSDRNFMLYR